MAFQPAQDTCLIEFKYSSSNGYTWQNNLHFTKPGFVSTDVDDLVALMIAQWTASNLRARMSLHAALDSVKGTDMRTEGAYSTEVAVALPGLTNADLVPPSMSVGITMRTALRGRSYRGRLYVGGLSEDSLSAGDWLTDHVEQVRAFIGVLQTSAAGIGWTMVVLSRAHNFLLRAIALGQAVVTLVVRSERPVSQRRRNKRL